MLSFASEQITGSARYTDLDLSYIFESARIRTFCTPSRRTFVSLLAIPATSPSHTVVVQTNTVATFPIPLSTSTSAPLDPTIFFFFLKSILAYGIAAQGEVLGKALIRPKRGL